MVHTGDSASFDDLTRQMARIQRGDEPYGHGSAALQATSFYIDHLLVEAVRRAREASVLPERQVDLLISVCGFAAVPTLLTFELLQPRRLLILRSQDAKESVNLIGRYLVGNGGLSFEDFQHDSVDSSDPLDMYGKIAKWLHGSDGEYAVIDITGGRKVMSAAAALAAWQLDLGLTYVESRFDVASRQPLPGQDKLIVLDNPTSLFGEQEMTRALEAFRSGAFEAARDRYGDICERVMTPPGRARLMRALCELYRAWCNLDLAALSPSVDTVRWTLQLVRREITSQTAETIDQQLSFAGRLVASDPAAFVVWFYILGQHYQRLGRYDFAAMLFYRTVEACLADRLRRRFAGFDPDDCDYTLIGDRTTLRTAYGRVAELLDPPAHPGPPAKMTLFAAALLLTAIDDDLARRCGMIDSSGAPCAALLKQLRDRTWARNKSVLAHGMETVSDTQTEALRCEAERWLSAYWGLHGDAVDLEGLCEQLQFLRTDQ